MQRTESELSERYFARIQGIEARWSEKARGWVRGNRRGRRVWANTNHIQMMVDLMQTSDYYIAACKALGHWPRRES